jgi:hypothetical protein
LSSDDATLFSSKQFRFTFGCLKDYYQILRIGRRASDTEIKRSYRRLAVLFHPDKNRSEEAIRLFQEINEAHSVLSDPLKRSAYDDLLSGRSFVDREPAPGPGWHRDPAYRRRQQGYTPPKTGPSEKLLMMLHLLTYLRTVSLVGIAWCGLLVIDYWLPFRISKEHVLPEGNRTITWQLHHEPNVVVTEKGNQFPIPFEGVNYFPEGSEIEVVSSRMFNILVKVEAQGDRYAIESLATVYQNLMIAPIMLLLVSLAGLFIKQGIEFRFNILVSICILLGFNLVFLLFSIL